MYGLGRTRVFAQRKRGKSIRDGIYEKKEREIKKFRSEITLLAFCRWAPKSPAARVILRDDRLIPI